MKHKKFLHDYWFKHYIIKDHTLCTICGNTGVMQTPKYVVTPIGEMVKSKKNYCICPNGRRLNPND